MGELQPLDQELVDQGRIPSHPRGLTEGEFAVIASGLRRTTFTGKRDIGGTPKTVEGEILAEAMELNERRNEQRRGK